MHSDGRSETVANRPEAVIDFLGKRSRYVAWRQRN